VHLAQVNIALPREPLDAPLLRDFVAALDPVNARADDVPGFVWRLQTDEGDATGTSVPSTLAPFPEASACSGCEEQMARQAGEMFLAAGRRPRIVVAHRLGRSVRRSHR
jgi:Domain of unknown function (DUF3291)